MIRHKLNNKNKISNSCVKYKSENMKIKMISVIDMQNIHIVDSWYFFFNSSV